MRSSSRVKETSRLVKVLEETPLVRVLPQTAVLTNSKAVAVGVQHGLMAGSSTAQGNCAHKQKSRHGVGGAASCMFSGPDLAPMLVFCRSVVLVALVSVWFIT